MASQTLATTCALPSKDSGQPSKNRLIREWIAKLALNAGQPLDAEAIRIYTALWSEAFDDLPYTVLEAAFRKTLRECKFWPLKVSDVRGHVERAQEKAIRDAADRAWDHVLDLRRRYWNPDIPGEFSRGMPALSPRIERSARAAGVFRDHESPEALHVWARKKFIESFVRWDETEEAQSFLLDGEIKHLLTGAAQAKALPAVN